MNAIAPARTPAPKGRKCPKPSSANSPALQERVTALAQQLAKGVAAEKCVFVFAQARERIVTHQLLIDGSGVAHDHGAIRKVVEEVGEQLSKIRGCGKIVGSGECRIGGDAARARLPAEAAAQQIEDQRLAVQR